MKNSNAIIDVVNAGGGSGLGMVAQRMLASGFNVEALRTNDVLRKEEWLKFDEVVINVARQRLVAVADLMNAGLTYDLPNALGVTQLQWEKISDFGSADISMGGLTNSENNRVTFDLASIPIPIVHKDFNINIRALEAHQRFNTPLDTTQAGLAARIVSETIETMLFNGSNIAGTSYKIPGYTTAANRITGSTTADWNTATGAQIVADVLAMIGAAAAKNMFGPFMIYCSVASMTHLGDDYKANSDLTILQRLLEIPGILGVKATANITDHGQVIMVQMTNDVVDMVDGIQPTTVMWESHGGFQINFKVMAILVPRIKDDKNSQSGIVHYS